MGILMSPCDDVEKLRLVDFKKNKVYTVKAIRVDDTILFQHDDGFSAARSLEAGKWAFPISFTSWAWQRHFLVAAAKLGVISKQAVDKEIARVDKKDREREIKSLKEDIERDKARLKKLQGKSPAKD